MPNVKMTPVSSSNVAEVGYDPGTRELHVRFHSGATYAYDDVGEETYQDLLNSNSPGKYLARWIKSVHSHRRL